MKTFSERQSSAAGIDVGDLDDVRALQRGGDLGLAPEAIGDGGHLGELLQQHLDGDGRAEPGVLRLVDAAHAADADAAHDAIFPAQQMASFKVHGSVVSWRRSQG